MAGESQVAPKLLKGGLAIYPSQDATGNPRFIVFQYNPESLRRTLASRTPPAAQGGGGGGNAPAREDLFRVTGPPTESISLSVVLNAADQLAEPDRNPATRDLGLHPVLSTLELLLYPASEQEQENRERAQQGAVQLAAATVPLVLFVWGKSRVLPVMISGFSVTEEHFDHRLNPISAKVDLNLKVLTTVELQPRTLGHDAYVSYHQNKEGMARRLPSSDDEPGVRGALDESRGGG